MYTPPPDSDISGARHIIGRGFLTLPILWRPLTSPLTHAPYIVYSHLSNFVQPFFKFCYKDLVLDFLLFDKDEYTHGIFQSVILVSIFVLRA